LTCSHLRSYHHHHLLPIPIRDAFVVSIPSRDASVAAIPNHAVFVGDPTHGAVDPTHDVVDPTPSLAV
jgi:hypothetical protein